MIGSRLADRYEVRRELGRGGMGVVFAAYDPLLDREVAVKLLAPYLLTPEGTERAQREAQVVARMDHPNIVPVFDVGQHEGSLFFVMPLVEGSTLRQLIEERSLRRDEIAAIARQVAEALDYSHGRGIVHRDVKPENILVSRPDGLRARVMDFGLARGAASRLTGEGVVLGTVAYLSPERLDGREADGRSDVYALGVVLYEALAGRPPFTGSVHAVLAQIAQREPLPLGPFGVEPDLEGLVMRCLRKDPAARPQRAREVAEALAAMRVTPAAAPVLGGDLTGPVQGLAPPPSSSSFVGRRPELAELQGRLHAAAGGAAQLVLVGGEAGVGKSRLVEELARSASAAGVPVLRGRFLEGDLGAPYHGFCELLLDDLRSGRRSGPTDLGDLAPGLLALFPMLAEVPSFPRAGAAGALRSGDASARIQVFDLLARTLLRLGRGRPLLVVLENLHAADVSVEALQYAARRLTASPTMVVGTWRPEETDRRHPLHRLIESFRGEGHFFQLDLQPLGAAEHHTLVSVLLGGEAKSDLARQLHEATEGNPFFTRELLRTLADSARIAPGSGPLDLRPGGLAEALPRTVQQVVERRLERLTAADRDLLASAAVLGRSFSFPDLAAVVPSSPDVEASVDRLVLNGFLAETHGSQGEDLAFTSRMLREVLYGELGPRRRRTLHRRVAEHLEARVQGRPEKALPALLDHFTRAEVPAKAVRYGLLAARRSLDTFSPDDAEQAAATVLRFLEAAEPPDPAAESEAHALLAEVHHMRGSVEGTLRACEAAVAAARRAGLPAQATACMVTATEAAWGGGRIAEAGRWADLGLEAEPSPAQRSKLLAVAIAVADVSGDYERSRRLIGELGAEVVGGLGSALPPEVLERRGDAFLVRGEYAAAEQAFSAAREERRRRSGEIGPADEARYLRKLAVVERKRGHFAEALAHCREGLRRIAARDPLLAAGLEALGALVDCDAGRFAEAEAWTDDGLARLRDPALAARPDLAEVEAALRRARGNVYLGQGRAREAAGEFQRGLELCQASGDRWEASIALFNLGDACAQAGEGARAERLLQAALAEKEAIGDRWGLAYTWQALATLHLDWGDARRAREEAAAGLALAESIEDPKAAAMLHLALGRAHAALGQEAEAREAFRTALDGAERISALPEALEAHLGLSDLAREGGRFEEAGLAADAARALAGRMAAGPGAAEAALARGRLQLVQGDLPGAAAFFEEALALATGAGSARHHIHALRALAELELLQGDYTAAAERCADVEAAARASGSRLEEVRAGLGLAEVELRRGRRPEALQRAQAAFAAVQALSAPRLVAEACLLLARLHAQVTEYARAESYALAAVRFYTTLGASGQRDLGRAYVILGSVYAEAVRPDEMRRAFEAALQLLEAYGDRANAAEAYRGIAALFTRDAPAEALQLLQRSLDAAGETGSRPLEAAALGDRGEVLRRLGRLDEALASFRREEQLVRAMGWRRGIAVNAFHRASIHAAQGQLEAGLEAATETVDTSREVGNLGLLYGLELRGELLTEMGRRREARSDLDEALALAEPLGHPERLANIRRTRAAHFLAQGDLAQADAEIAAAREAAQGVPEATLKEHGYLVRERVEVVAARAALLRGATAEARRLLAAPAELFARLQTPAPRAEASLVDLSARRADGEDIERDVRDLVERSRGVSALVHVDALLLLAEAGGGAAAAQEAGRLAAAMGSAPREARARLVATLAAG